MIFFGVPNGFVDIPTEDEDDMQWEKWGQIWRGDYYHGKLEERGIEVIFYDETDKN